MPPKRRALPTRSGRIVPCDHGLLLPETPVTGALGRAEAAAGRRGVRRDRLAVRRARSVGRLDRRPAGATPGSRGQQHPLPAPALGARPPSGHTFSAAAAVGWPPTGRPNTGHRSCCWKPSAMGRASPGLGVDRHLFPPRPAQHQRRPTPAGHHRTQLRRHPRRHCTLAATTPLRSPSLRPGHGRTRAGHRRRRRLDLERRDRPFPHGPPAEGGRARPRSGAVLHLYFRTSRCSPTSMCRTTWPLAWWSSA